ncbi:MAG: hypothetical protein IV088_09435 [Hydrogenophaga sp.]|uniref:hypothetical protein n=1 Tax=Hydrogenophaga sp. TaxID=1904254 RepID=UPI0025B7B9F3|nr:hypothetical protein [Hydrogenophaga sp.]MBT9551057.1 hypothetical protein [Hydrogenophaga sp.]
MRAFHKVLPLRLARLACALGLCWPLLGCERGASEGGHAIALQIERAPGPFGSVNGEALYRAEACPQAAAEKTLPIPFTRLDEHRYTATVRNEAPPDAGPDSACQWRLVSTAVGLSATGAPEDERYVAQLSADEVDAGQPVRRFYWRGTYPRMPGALITRNLGETDPEVFRPEFRKVLFSITLTATALP